MAQKGSLYRFQNIVNGDMSLTSITSKITNLQFLDNVGLQLVFTGSPTGTFDVEVSASYEQDSLGNVINAGTWTPITLSPVPEATGSAGNIYIDINQTSSPWIRVVYTKGSGSGTLNSFITAKAV